MIQDFSISNKRAIISWRACILASALAIFACVAFASVPAFADESEGLSSSDVSPLSEGVLQLENGSAEEKADLQAEKVVKSVDVGTVNVSICQTTSGIITDTYIKFKPKNGASTGRMGAVSAYDYEEKILKSGYITKVTKIVTEGKISCYGDLSVAWSSGLFTGFTSLNDISGLAKWDVSEVTDFSFMFSNCKNLSNLTPLKSWNVKNATDFGWMFDDCQSLTDLSPLSKWNTSNVTVMKAMFAGCKSLKNLSPLSSWRTGKVSNFGSMFSGCSMTDVSALSNWSFGNTTIGGMFADCTKLSSIKDMANWDVSRVTNMMGLFSGCTALKSTEGLSAWKTTKLESVGSLFSGCTSLTDITDLISWDTSNVSDVSEMFKGCTKLSKVTALYGWSGKKLTQTFYVFEGCTSLEDGCVFRDWGFDNSQVAHSFFRGCNNLSSVDFTFLNKASSSVWMNASTIMGGCESKKIRSFRMPNSKDKFMSLDNLPDNNPLDVAYIQTLYPGTTFHYSLLDGTRIASLEDLINGWDKYKLSGNYVFISSDQVVDVSFVTNGGSSVKSQEFLKGNCATKPSDPTRENYNFDGWYSDSNFKTAFDFTKKVTKNTTLYAKWSLKAVEMYRLYNKWTGEHFYTSKLTEKTDLMKAGWTDEGVGWTAPSTSSEPVYRLYNKYVPGGDHHYTTSVEEKNNCVKAGWTYEGIGWYSDPDKGVALYRQYNPYAITGSHNYTANVEENDKLVKAGWKAEGIAWYGLK